MSNRERNAHALAALLVVAATSACGTLARAQCGELTLADAVQQALDANQALVAARETLEARHKDIAIARSTMLPAIGGGLLGQFSKDRTFSSSAGVIPERVLKGGAEITQTLYNQSYIDALGAQKHAYESQRHTLEDTRNQTIAEVGQSYVGLLLAEALMMLQEENVTLSEGSLELTEAQESAGEVPYSNVLRMRSQLYGAQQGAVSQKGNVLRSRFGFNQVRNRPAEEVCVLQPLTVDDDGFVFASTIVAEALTDDEGASLVRDFLVELGIDRSPSLRSLDAQIRAEQREMKSSRRWLIPSLDAAAATAGFFKTDGAGSSATQDNEFFWQAGVSLGWNVLDGGAFIATMNQNKLEFWSLRSQRNNLATSLEEDIRGTAATAMASFERIALADLQARAAAENFALVNEAYLDGASTLLDLIDAQDQLITASTSARQALYQFLSDLLSLEQSIAYYPFLEADAAARARELEAELRGR